MRASPRTWPSMRLSRLSTDVLATGCMPAIYPYRVSVSRFFAMDHAHSTHPPAGTEAAARDPVCGMRVDPAKTPHRFTFHDRDFFFCCAGCRNKFAADPEKYLGGDAATVKPPPNETKPQPDGAIYPCPMHPQVLQVGPGACPICGMALEPEAGAAAEEDGGERAIMVRRLWICALSDFTEFALTTPIVLWGGWPFLVRGAQSLVTRHLNMFTLIAMGTGVAY